MSETAAPDNPAPFAPALETLAGDIRDWLLDTLRRVDKAWTKLSEAEQRHIIESAAGQGRQVVRASVELVSAYEFPTVSVTVGKGQFDGEQVIAKITADDTDENLLAIARADKAVLVLATPEKFFGQRADAKVEPDQPEMPLDADQPETAEDAAFREQVLDGAGGEETLDAWTYDFAAGTRAHKETGEIQPIEEAGLTPELQEALKRFQEEKAADDARKAEKATRRRGKSKAAEPEAENVTAWKAAGTRGAEAFHAGLPGIIPDDLAGTVEGQAYLQAWGRESKASAERRDGAPPLPDAPARELADA